MHHIFVRFSRQSCLALALSACFAEAVFAQIQLNRVPSRALGHPQLNVVTGNPNLVEGRELYQPAAIAVDTSAQPPALYIADFGNNRILGWRNASAFENGAVADLVLGQRDLRETSPKGPGTTLSTGLNGPVALAVDRDGNLYVADANNNRILRFPRPFSQTDDQKLPDMVIGQPNYQANLANAGNANPSAQTLVLRTSSGPLRSGLVFDSQGNLYFSDSGNNRVLRYPASALSRGQNQPAADVVLGQFSFTTRNSPPQNDPRRKDGLLGPAGLTFDTAGRLYVCDDLRRVLVYPTLTTGAPAARILGVVVVAPGQPAPPEVNERSLSRGGSPPSGVFFVGGTPFVLDSAANRIVRFDPFESWPAESETAFSPPGRLFIGQSDSTSFRPNGGQPEPSNAVFFGPVAAAVSGNEVYIVDAGNNRVLVFPVEGGTIRAAARLLGQGSFNESAPNRIDGREFFLWNGYTQVGAGLVSEGAGVVVDTSSNPPHLYVADTFNNRILGFADARKVRPGDRADIVIGQRDFSRALVNEPTNDPDQITDRGLARPAGLAVDAGGNLYVADSGNGRVLRFQRPFDQPGTIAPDLVIGQQNFFQKITDATPRNMSRPFGLAFTVDGHLLVSDALHHRVLFFRKPDGGDFSSGQAAEKVFGQPDFISVQGSSAANRMASPHHIATDTDDRLYVADTGNNRVLIYDRVPTAPTDPSPALPLLGTGRFGSPHGIYVSPRTGEIWVTDTQGGRVLRYPRFEILVLVDPIPDYDVVASNALAVTQDGTGNLIVAEALNRISFFYPGMSAANGAHGLQRFAPCTYTTIRPVTGASFGDATLTFSELETPNMPKSLGDIEVYVNDVPAAIQAVAPGEIKFIIPNGTPTSGDAEVVVIRRSTGQIAATGALAMNRIAPAFFTLDGTGNGQVVAKNEDGSENSPVSMAPRSGFISIYGTGLGCVAGAPPDGEPTPDKIPFEGETRVIIGTTSAGFIPQENIRFSGLAPGLIATWLLEVKIPDNVAPDIQVPIAATVNSVATTMGTTSTRVRTTVAVKP